MRSAWPCTGSSSSGGSGGGWTASSSSTSRHAGSTGCARRRRSSRSARTDPSPSPCPTVGRWPCAARSTASTPGPIGWPSSTTRPAGPGPARRTRSSARDLRLQLPIYALAARDLLGRPDAEVVAEYWHLHDQHDGRKRLPVDVDPPTMARLSEVLAAIVDGIADGLFVPAPGRAGPLARAPAAPPAIPTAPTPPRCGGSGSTSAGIPCSTATGGWSMTWTTTRPRPTTTEPTTRPTDGAAP